VVRRARPHSRRVLRRAAAAAAAFSAGGCLGGSLFVSGSGSTRVESVPTGAEVYVMGERLGTTPLDVADARLFPVHYPRELSDLYGKVVLRHPGCEELVRAVDLQAANEGISASLVCGDTDADGDRPSAEAPADRAAAPPTRPAVAPHSAADRLAQIKALRRDGLLDEREARSLRDRALRESLDDRPPADALRSLESLHAAGAIDDAEYRARRTAILDRL
jgi:hypothetical protein